MSITFANLRTEVSAALRDPSGKTFDSTAVGRLVNAGLAEVGRLAPAQFVEDITPVADTMSYVVRSSVFGGVAQPEIELTRVEIWDASQTPDEQKYMVSPASAEYMSNTDVGWTMWGGTLYLPRWVHTVLDGNEASYVIRVYGYSPYAPLSADGDVAPISREVQEALVYFCTVEALARLQRERELYTQWQTRSGNTDISPAGLMNAYNIARDEWRRRSRAILRLRSTT